MMKNMGLGLDSDALAILWATPFACLLIYGTTKSGLSGKRLLHWITRSPNSLLGVKLELMASYARIFESVSNSTTCIPFEIATLIASSKPRDSASKIVADEW